jgi:hypothetical protein
MNCSLDEALALLNKWRAESTQVFAVLMGTPGPLDSSFVGMKTTFKASSSGLETPLLFMLTTLATVDECDDQGMLIKWSPNGHFFLVFKDATFQYSEPRDIPPEIIQQAECVLVGTLKIFLPYGSTFVVCETATSPG